MLSKTPAARAPRYALKVPLRYRAAGRAHWLDGLSENISRSGVLFLAAECLDADTPIEMLLTLGALVGDHSTATVMCRGRVVRVIKGDDEEHCAALAATIAGYRLLHNQGTDPRRI